jgi:photosystem II stability/assembly factor-like uncharacterized protein
VRTISIIAIALLAVAVPGLKARPPSAAPGLRTRPPSGWWSPGPSDPGDQPAAASVTVPTSGLRWRNIGPFRAGRVAAVAGAVGQPGVFYIGLPFGGVWKTTSGGTTWSPVFDGVTEIASIASIAVAPSDPDVVYAGTGDPYRASYRGNGLYKSTDAGTTWRHLSLGETKVPTILVDPKNPDIVIAAALGNVQTKSDVRGVFRSTDGGATWTRTLAVDDETGVNDLAASFDRPDVVFAVSGRYYEPEPGGPAGTSTSTGAVFKSTDEGATWTPLPGRGLPALGGNGRMRRLAVAARTNAGRVFLAGDGPLMRSDDGGATWKAVTDDRRPGAERVYVSPDNPDLVYGLHITAYRSRDGGATWEAFKGAPGGDDPHVMWIDPTDPNRILLAGDQGASVSVDGGNTWGSWYNQSTAQIYHIDVDRSWPYWVYGQQQDSGAVAVRDRGNLGAIGPLDWYPTPGWEAGYIVADPMDPKIVYANGPDSYSQLVRLWVPTGQWIHVGPNLDPAEQLGTPGPLVWNPYDPTELMVGYSRVMSTTDGGRHWTALSPSFTGSRASILALAASHISKGLLWVGFTHGGVRLTRDHGESWTNVSIPDAQASIVSLDASHHDAAEAFAAVTTGDNRPHIYRTRDYGKTWMEVVNGLPADQASGSVVNCVRIDTRRAGLVFAATESSVYVSFDDGDRWQPLRLNLPTTSVRDIVIHGNDLVIATFGRGIWVLDDYSPLRQITSAVEDQPVHLFRPGSGIRVRRNIGGDTPFPPEIPQADNPPLGVVIYYSITRTPAAPITIDILDTAGRLVRHMSSAPVPPITPGGREFPDWWLSPPKPLPTNVGLNHINWNVRYDDPPSSGEHVTIRAVPGDTPMYYEGPLALPGIYTVRLTVDGRRYTQRVRVWNDPRSPATPADLREQHALQMRIYRSVKGADRAARQVNDLRTAASRLASTEALAEPLTAFTRSLGSTALSSFDRIRDAMNHVLEELDSADFAPTPSMMGAYAAPCRDLRTALSTWRTVQSQQLARLNAALAAAGAPRLPVPARIPLPACPAPTPR